MKGGRKVGSRKVRVSRNTRRVGGKVSRRRSGGFGPEPTSPQPHLIGDL